MCNNGHYCKSVQLNILYFLTCLCVCMSLWCYQTTTTTTTWALSPHNCKPIQLVLKQAKLKKKLTKSVTCPHWETFVLTILMEWHIHCIWGITNNKRILHGCHKVFSPRFAVYNFCSALHSFLSPLSLPLPLGWLWVKGREDPTTTTTTHQVPHHYHIPSLPYPAFPKTHWPSAGRSWPLICSESHVLAWPGLALAHG